MFLPDQILVNSHWELNITYPIKRIARAKIGLVCRVYSFMHANRNILKKHISASPTVSFSARTFKAFKN